MKRCGYWISERKRQKMKFDTVIEKCRENNVEMVKIDLRASLEEQGPFDMVLHKFTDKLGGAYEGNSESIKHIQNFEEYTKAHPSMPVLDPVPKVKRLLDRHRQYSIAKQSPLFTNEGGKFMIPAFVDFPTSNVEDNKLRMKKANVNYPILCKPILAHGPETCHKMTLIFNDKGLNDVNPPCVAQTFVPHGAVLFKLYVLGDQFSIVERPSLKNFKASDHETIIFNSHDVSKPTSTSSLSELDEEDKDFVIKRPSYEDMVKISDAIRESFSLQLLGIDVIVENKTGKLGVIDVNAFPGYEGSAQFPDMFYNLIRKTLDQAENQNKREPFSGHSQQHNGNTLAVQNGSSTHPPSKNGSENGVILSKRSATYQLNGEKVDNSEVPLKKSKAAGHFPEMDESQVKTGPRSLSPDH